MSELPMTLADSHPDSVMDKEDFLGHSHSPRVNYAVYQSVNGQRRGWWTTVTQPLWLAHR